MDINTTADIQITSRCTWTYTNDTVRATLTVAPIRAALVVALFVVLSAFTAQSQTAPITVRQVIDKIKKETGMKWTGETVDVFKIGNPDVPVTGIVTTMFATMDVLKEAVAKNCNLIITHEPTFYNHTDDSTFLIRMHDAVYSEKRRYIQEHHIVIWRFHDHIHMMHPDLIIKGVINRLGWEKYQVPGLHPIFLFPEMNVRQLAEQVKKSMGTSLIRVIGNPDLRITKAGFEPGAPGSEMQMTALERKDVEVLLIGESREWETVEYARDATEQGLKKALIILGHVPSEEAGMEECARWLKTFITDIPVQYIKTPEPYWVLE